MKKVSIREFTQNPYKYLTGLSEELIITKQNKPMYILNVATIINKKQETYENVATLPKKQPEKVNNVATLGNNVATIPKKEIEVCTQDTLSKKVIKESIKSLNDNGIKVPVKPLIDKMFPDNNTYGCGCSKGKTRLCPRHNRM